MNGNIYTRAHGLIIYDPSSPVAVQHFARSHATLDAIECVRKFCEVPFRSAGNEAVVGSKRLTLRRTKQNAVRSPEFLVQHPRTFLDVVVGRAVLTRLVV